MDSGITPLTSAQEAAQEAKAAKEGYIHRNLVAVDQELNVLTGGHPDETISSRDARDAEAGHLPAKVLSHVLDVFQKNHGAKAMAGDLERAKVVEKLESE